LRRRGLPPEPRPGQAPARGRSEERLRAEERLGPVGRREAARGQGLRRFVEPCGRGPRAQGRPEGPRAQGPARPRAQGPPDGPDPKNEQGQRLQDKLCTDCTN
jgi:hypothetical protein